MLSFASYEVTKDVWETIELPQPELHLTAAAQLEEKRAEMRQLKLQLRDLRTKILLRVRNECFLFLCQFLYRLDGGCCDSVLISLFRRFVLQLVSIGTGGIRGWQ